MRCNANAVCLQDTILPEDFNYDFLEEPAEDALPPFDEGKRDLFGLGEDNFLLGILSEDSADRD